MCFCIVFSDFTRNNNVLCGTLLVESVELIYGLAKLWLIGILFGAFYMMTELISTVLIFAGQYMKGVSDSTAYDEKAHNEWEKLCREYITTIQEHIDANDHRFSYPEEWRFHHTHYHTGHPNDAWHWFSRLSVYLTYIGAGIGYWDASLDWHTGILLMAHIIAGWAGFNCGDRWRGSMWTRKIGAWIDG